MMTVYWRRKYESPVECIGAVQVVRGEHWSGEPLDHDESHDTGWHRLDIDFCGGAEVVADIWEPLGLCGELTDPTLIADAVCVAAAIMAELGIRPPMPDDMVYDCPWRPSDLDDGGTDDNPSDAYAALQVHCASVYEELREKLAEAHGIDITPLAAN
jgi:hypothetical protein